MLARRLAAYAHRPDVVVLALPRGGVPLGCVIARALALPLDVLVVRKLALPGYPEYAVGAVAGDGPFLLNDVALAHGWAMQAIEAQAARERQEIARRERQYRTGRAALPLEGKTVILVDDGIATGATMRMAVRLARTAKAASVVVAVPVAPVDVCAALAAEVDQMLCLRTPSPFYSVGHWYRDFDQLNDAQVVRMLARAAQ